VTTLVVSDLHLGVPSGGDVLRAEPLRARLLGRAAAADRIVLLGDIVELREGPPGPAMAVAEPVLRALGEAAPGVPITIVPGNHDHRLIGRWLRTRRHRDGVPLGLAETVEPAEASPEAERIAAALGPGRVEFSYPGVWLRPDVYALHGHHLDRHITVPSFERIGLAGVARWGLQGRAATTPDGYEAVFGPLYALLFALAEESPPADGAPGAGSSTRAWRVLVGDGGKRPAVHRIAAAAGFPALIAMLNRAGLGPLSPRISGPELRRAGLRALHTALGDLGVGAHHVVFGHTHRAGPFPGDELAEWRRPGGGSIVNGGSWVYQPLFLGRSAPRNPYWPGNCVLVGDDGPPRIERLLTDLDRDALARALS
jgi:Calcineurin-like phosphoesterase